MMAKSESKTGPVEFVQQVKAETKKVTWPSRKETTVSVIAVFIMVTVASLFLFFADQLIAVLINFILGLGR
jgi:preprotein translocase subunit SecE